MHLLVPCPFPTWLLNIRETIHVKLEMPQPFICTPLNLSSTVHILHIIHSAFKKLWKSAIKKAYSKINSYNSFSKANWKWVPTIVYILFILQALFSSSSLRSSIFVYYLVNIDNLISTVFFLYRLYACFPSIKKEAG